MRAVRREKDLHDLKPQDAFLSLRDIEGRGVVVVQGQETDEH